MNSYLMTIKRFLRQRILVVIECSMNTIVFIGCCQKFSGADFNKLNKVLQ